MRIYMRLSAASFLSWGYLLLLLRQIGALVLAPPEDTGYWLSCVANFHTCEFKVTCTSTTKLVISGSMTSPGSGAGYAEFASYNSQLRPENHLTWYRADTPTPSITGNNGLEAGIQLVTYNVIKTWDYNDYNLYHNCQMVFATPEYEPADTSICSAYGQPSSSPSGQPSSAPSIQPSGQPSGVPSAQPTGVPSGQPSGLPTGVPSGQPNAQPTGQPTVQPTSQPSIPTSMPSSVPTSAPTESPPDPFYAIMMIIGITVAACSFIVVLGLTISRHISTHPAAAPKATPALSVEDYIKGKSAKSTCRRVAPLEEQKDNSRSRSRSSSSSSASGISAPPMMSTKRTLGKSNNKVAAAPMDGTGPPRSQTSSSVKRNSNDDDDDNVDEKSFKAVLIPS